MLLLLNILLNKREGCAPDGRTKIRVRPQCWQLPLQHGKRLTQETRGTALDQLHQAMHAKLGIDAHQEMDMIGHHFEFFDVVGTLVAARRPLYEILPPLSCSY